LWQALVAVSLLSGCGVSAASGPAAPSTVRATSRSFAPTTIHDLASRLDFTDGQRVSFEGSFGPVSYPEAYLVTRHGYQLWDHDGHFIRVSNIYTETRPGAGGSERDESRDFNATGRSSLLAYGKFVRIEGTYVASFHASSHGGVFRVPPQIDVWFIDGKPTRDFVSR